jgi:hypothetical protein
MTEHDRLRRLLEPEAPRLDPAAAARLDARVDAALARRGRRGLPRWSLAAAPALLALALLLWFAPWQQGPVDKGYFMLTEDEYVAALEQYQAAGGDPEEAFSETYDTDDTGVDFDASNWNDEDWELFRKELEDFQLAENGGK